MGKTIKTSVIPLKFSHLQNKSNLTNKNYDNAVSKIRIDEILNKKYHLPERIEKNKPLLKVKDS